MYASRCTSIPSPDEVTRAAIRRADETDQDTVDAFWRCKNEVYKWIINSRKGVLSDFACRSFMRRHIESIRLEEDYFGTEGDIFRKLPGLKALLERQSFEHDVMQHIGAPISYQARRYYIDRSGDFFARQDSRRYRLARRVRTLRHDSVAARAVDGEQGVLFRDH